MRQENYTRLIWAVLALSVLILVAFQLYINREPTRIQTVRAADQATEIAAGEELYQKNCASCHGDQGEGVDAPALNNLAVLRDTPDETLFDLTVNGVPGTEMPAWGQARGGPFTDEEIKQMVAYIRSWEPTAPDLGEQRMRVDAQRGAQIFAATCVVCHGENGQGGTASAINDPAKLQQFDNEWYAETIAKGRPAQGMPVWGTVLSPQQIGDLVALIDVWRQGGEIIIGDVDGLLQDAIHALEHNETVEAIELLEQATGSAGHDQADIIEEAIAALDAGNTQEALTIIEQAQAMGDGGQDDAGDEHNADEEEHDAAEEEHDAEEEEHDVEEGDTAGEEHDAAEEEHDAAEEEHDALEEEHDAAEEGDAAEEEHDADEETEAEAVIDPGIAHLQEAVHALEHNELDEAEKALTEAMELLSPGELFEAAEHGLEDIEAGKPEEALTVLQEALIAAGIPLLEE